MKLEFKLPIIPRRLFVFTVFSILLLSACPSEEKSADAKTPLILISMDGFRWDYFDKTDTPNFDELIQLGSQARALIPVFPQQNISKSHFNSHGPLPRESWHHCQYNVRSGV